MLLRTGKSLTIAISGAAAALVLGVLAGQAMQPDLNMRTDRPMGPQMFADWAGEGTTGPFDGGTTFVAYHGAAPDYVLGSDWKRLASPPSETAVLTKASYEEPVEAEAPATLESATAPHVDDPRLARNSDDTTVAEADPNNPAREPAYEQPAVPPEPPGAN